MSASTVTVEGMDIFKNLQRLGDRAATVVSRTGNRSLTGAKTDAGKLIPQHYNVKANAVKKHIKTKKMKPSFLTGDVIFSHDKGLPLVLFSPKPKSPSIGIGSRRLKSVKLKSGKIKKGDWRAPLRGGASAEVTKGVRKKQSSAFIAKTKSGHIGVFRRSNRTRWGGTSDIRYEHDVIEQIYGPSISQMIKKKVIMREVKTGMARRYKKELPAQIRHEARKLGIDLD